MEKTLAGVFYTDTPTVYRFTHTYLNEPLYLQSHIPPDCMELLVAYIQFRVAKLQPNTSLSQGDIVQVLVSLYGCKVSIKATPHYDIDLFENLKILVFMEKEIMKCQFDVPGLELELKKILSNLQG